MGGIGGPELLLVFLVVLLVFGPRKIPEVARGIGKGLREFRRLSVDLQREINLAETAEERTRETEAKGRPRGDEASPDPPASGPDEAPEESDSRPPPEGTQPRGPAA